MQINSGFECLLIVNLGRQQSSNDARFVGSRPGNSIDRKYTCQLAAHGAQETLAKINRYKLLNDPSKYHQLHGPIDQRPPRAEPEDSPRCRQGLPYLSQLLFEPSGVVALKVSN